MLTQAWVPGTSQTRGHRTLTAPSSGIVEAGIAGSGDWDLAVFDAAGQVVAASAGFSGREVATGFVDAGTELTVQGCLLSGKGSTVMGLHHARASTRSSPSTTTAAWTTTGPAS